MLQIPSPGTPPVASTPPSPDCDVLVIGGGPAGSTVAALLADKGHRVTLLEKDAHPRFHIGESLLPANLPLFEQLGVADEVRAIGIEKWAAEFMSPWHDAKLQFQFGEAMNKTLPMAYQVRRSEFDEILFRHAVRRGAHAIEHCRVEAVDFDTDPALPLVTARQGDGALRQFRTRFVIDASGRDTFLSNRFQIKEKNPRHNSLAVFGHFSGVQRNTGRDEGNITIYWFDHGWFWFIPLKDGTTSIGMVTWPYFMKTRGERGLKQFLMDGIALTPALAERMKGATLVSEPEATGNFSYTSARNHGTNYVMLGDAYAFIDPVFSSGVMLAMQGAFAASDAIDTWLRHPAQRTQALARLDRVLRHGPREFSWLIYRMTNPVMRDLFMAPRNVFRVKEALLSLLAGDIYGQTPIWNRLLIFKGIYYASSIMQPRRAWRAWRQRQINIRPVEGVT